MINTLVSVLNNRNITPYLWVSDGSQNDLKPAVDFMCSKHVYAIVCDNTCPPSSAADTLAGFKSGSLPSVIMINSYKDTPGVINIICDIKDTFMTLVSNTLKSGAVFPAFLFLPAQVLESNRQSNVCICAPAEPQILITILNR